MAELEALRSLKDKHLTVLEEHRITGCRALVLEERKVILEWMSGIRKPLPTLEDIAGWQDEARRQLKTQTTAGETSSSWDVVASFAVNFERQNDEHQLAVGQAEPEGTAPPPMKTWSGWECADSCAWMHDLAIEEEARQAADVRTGAEGGESGPARPSGARATTKRQAITIDRVTLINETGKQDVPPRGDETSPIPVGQGARLSVSVGVPDEAGDVYVAARIRLASGEGENLGGYHLLPKSKELEFPLDALPAGTHAVRILAWTDARDGRAVHGRRELPPLQRTEESPTLP